MKKIDIFKIIILFVSVLFALHLEAQIGSIRSKSKKGKNIKQWNSDFRLMQQKAEKKLPPAVKLPKIKIVKPISHLGCFKKIKVQRVNLDSVSLKKLKLYEDTLANIMKVLYDTLYDPLLKKNMDSSLLFVLKKALLVKNSFAYPFPKWEEFVNIIYPEDSNFRIITWQFTLDNIKILKQGIIQMNDSVANIFPLIDRSNLIVNVLDTITDYKNWIGSAYYQIITNSINEKPVYTVIGIDDNHVLSTRKWVDILTFNHTCKPVFGGHYFNFTTYDKSDTTYTRYVPNRLTARYYIEYNKLNVVNMKYDDLLGGIIFDHLAPLNKESIDRKYTYNIDGDYEGFEWKDNQWKYIPQWFEYQLRDGEAPIQNPLNFNPNSAPIKIK